MYVGSSDFEHCALQLITLISQFVTCTYHSSHSISSCEQISLIYVSVKLKLFS